MNLFKSRGKFEYALLEYIQTSGSQYLNIDVSGNSNLFKVILDCQFLFTSLGSYYNGFKTGSYYFLLGVHDNTYRVQCGYDNSEIDFGTSDNNRHTFNLDATNSKLIFDNTSYSLDVDKFSVSRFLLGAYGTSSSVTSYAPEKIYSCSFYYNGSLIRDLVPVKRLKDGAVGLYDKVNDKLYTNNGSGEFIQGKVIGRF